MPTPMVKVNKLAEVLDESPPPDIISELKEAKKMRKWITSFDQMDKKEQRYYDEKIIFYNNQYKNLTVWSEQIIKLLKYK